LQLRSAEWSAELLRVAPGLGHGLKHRRDYTMRFKSVPVLEGLEDRWVMSHVIPSLHHALSPHPAIVHPPKVHPPVVHQVTSFGAHHSSIVHHVNLKAAAAKLDQETTGFGGGNIDFTIPFIVGTEVGAKQNALNFTSNTYQNVLFGTGGWDGIQQIVERFDSNGGDVNQLTADISALSFRMPYGNQMLLPTWTADLQSLQSGTLTPTSSGIVWDNNANASGQAVGDVLFADLQTYLSAGLGTSFNILKSVINWNNSDNLLTYNGTVGSNNLT